MENKKKMYLVLLSSLMLTGCASSVSYHNEDGKAEQFDYEGGPDEVDDEYEETSNDNVIMTNAASKNQNLLLPKNDFESEEEVVKYFKKMRNQVKELAESNKPTYKRIKRRVMTYVRFITNDIKVGGYSFKDLSKKAKKNIKAYYVEVDCIIEQNKPGYKERLKEKSIIFKEFCKDSYETIKEQVITWYNEGTLKENLYDGIFGGLDDDIDELKEDYSDIVDYIKIKIKEK